MDNNAYRKFVETKLKIRKDNKIDKETNFYALRSYGICGKVQHLPQRSRQRFTRNKTRRNSST